MNNQEVAHKFAYKQAANGSNFYSDGECLFSYNTCIAQWYGDICLVSDTNYSISTTRHQSYTSRALSHVQTVSVANRWGSRYITEQGNFTELRESIQYAKKELAEAKPAVKGKYAIKLRNLFGRIRAISNALPDWTTINELYPSETELAEINALASEYETKLADRYAKREEQRNNPKITLFDWPTILADWKAGKRQTIKHNGTLDYLRLRPKLGIIETSQGVKVPVDLALRFYNQLVACKDAGCLGLHLQSYQVRSITNDYVVIGCHTIAWSELNEMHEQVIDHISIATANRITSAQ